MTTLVTEPERLPEDSSVNNCLLLSILRSYCPTFHLSQLFTSVYLLSNNKWGTLFSNNYALGSI
jgi:hypothetical protein